MTNALSSRNQLLTTIPPLSTMLSRKWILEDALSPTHAQALKATLYSLFNVQRPLMETLPPGYHLIYFNPKSHEDTLWTDGYDTHQQPDHVFKRRMWIGGEMKFDKGVRLGDPAVCVEKIASMRKLKENTFVNIKREISVCDDLLIEEKRSLIYTPENFHGVPLKQSGKNARFSHMLKVSELLIFRYSALTFNAHKIHYDKEYARSEGYPSVLMQGPLSVTLLLEWVGTLFEGLVIKEFRYKNCAPIFAGDTIKLCLQETANGMDLWIENDTGAIMVEGSLVAV